MILSSTNLQKRAAKSFINGQWKAEFHFHRPQGLNLVLRAGPEVAVGPGEGAGTAAAAHPRAVTTVPAACAT